MDVDPIYGAPHLHFTTIRIFKRIHQHTQRGCYTPSIINKHQHRPRKSYEKEAPTALPRPPPLPRRPPQNAIPRRRNTGHKTALKPHFEATHIGSIYYAIGDSCFFTMQLGGDYETVKPTRPASENRPRRRHFNAV
jgi:hypothetical protein